MLRKMMAQYLQSKRGEARSRFVIRTLISRQETNSTYLRTSRFAGPSLMLWVIGYIQQAIIVNEMTGVIWK